MGMFFAMDQDQKRRLPIPHADRLTTRHSQPRRSVPFSLISMSALTPEQLDRLQSLLDERERSLRSHLQRENDTRDQYLQVASEAPDPGDASFATLSIDLGNAAVGRDLSELRAIGAARRRIERGDYGDCAHCGYEIPYARLLAQPTAERCAPCQNNFERTHAEGGNRSSL